MKVLRITLFICLVSLSGCGEKINQTQVKLLGRAVLPADTFVAGPPVGMALDPEINGRKLPFASLPVQGISSLIPVGNDKYLALQDNGFGTKKNSPDYPLGWFLIEIHFGQKEGIPGSVDVLQTTHLSDPDEFFPFPITHPDGGRFFTGADLDPESFVRLPDGSIWLGDEFGPWLLHFSADGELLSAPVGLPTPNSMMSYTGNEKEMRSPDHPEVIASAKQFASLPRSGGLEGLALSQDGKFLFAAVEKSILADSQPTRRMILEFDLDLGTFTNRTRYYQTDGADISLAALETWGNGELLVTERDGGQGLSAKVKRIYLIKLASLTSAGFMQKELVCDLMSILDDTGLTRAESGAVGLGSQFTFPFVTPEVLVAIDHKTILVANDNNYPMSCGRRPSGIPDNSEFVLLGLP